MKEVKIVCAVEIAHTLYLNDDEAKAPITINDCLYAEKVKEYLKADSVVVLELKTAVKPAKDFPPYMDTPRNPCAGCVHEQRPKSVFPCDECKRELNGEHDMFVEVKK